MHATGAVCLTFLDFSLEEVHTSPIQGDLDNAFKVQRRDQSQGLGRQNTISKGS